MHCVGSGGTIQVSARGRQALAVAVLLLVAAPASATVVWRGDFETGTTKQWTSLLFGPHITVVGTPVRHGKFAARCEVHNEDKWGNGLRRVELSYTPTAATFENSERYYAFSVMQAPDMPLSQTYRTHIGYWESYPLYKQVMDFSVDKNQLVFSAWLNKPDGRPGGTLFRGSFAPGRWHDFVLHVKWSTDPGVGFIELWYDGVRVVNKIAIQTMHLEAGTKYPSFFHIGVLRGDFEAEPVAVFVDSVMDATTFDDVALLAVPPDGGAPMPDAGASRADASSTPPRDAVSGAEVRRPPDGSNPTYNFDTGGTFGDDPLTPLDDKPYTIKTGCSFGAGSPGGWLFLPLAFALLLLRRRR